MSRVSMHELAIYAREQLEAGIAPSLIARKLAAYLLENRQSRELTKVLRAIEAELNKHGSTQVSIVSVHAVSDEIKKELASLLDAKNPVFSETTDKSLIGGVKARKGELEVDLSVKGKLQRFKSEIMRSV